MKHCSQCFKLIPSKQITDTSSWHNYSFFTSLGSSLVWFLCSLIPQSVRHERWCGCSWCSYCSCVLVWKSWWWMDFSMAKLPSGQASLELKNLPDSLRSFYALFRQWPAYYAEFSHHWFIKRTESFKSGIATNALESVRRKKICNAFVFMIRKL